MFYLPAPPETLLLPARLKTVRVFSYGGGVQSNAVLALQAQGKLFEPYDYFIFANVGEDSENPATIEYFEKIAKPFAEKHGIKFVMVQKTTYNKPETLCEYIKRAKRSVPIPARMSNGAPGNRSCTIDFKIKPINKWIKQQRFSNAIIGLGISTDEIHRMRHERWHSLEGKRKIGFERKREHPLIHLRISRAKCKEIISDAGLPIPPKSSCFFCPFMRRNEWIELKRKNPTLFDKAVAIDEIINVKRKSINRDRVYLHVDLVPLRNAVGNQMVLPGFLESDMDICESGFCFG